MSSPTEQLLRELFAAEAGAAPERVDLVGGALRMVRDRRRFLAAVGTCAVVIVAVVAGVLATAGPRQPSTPPIAALAPSTTQPILPSENPAADSTGQGPVPFGGTESCVETYSPAALAGQAFAFDGTVIAIGPTLPHRPHMPLGLVAVTFRVNQWFRGGSGATATVDWYPPGQRNSATDSSLASYGVGSRLLVSGRPRWGGGPLDNATASTCGFTRYYDSQTAADWAVATH